MFSDYGLVVIATLTIIFGDLMLMLTPTLIRFSLIRRKLKYGTEICGYLVVSLFTSLYANFLLQDIWCIKFGNNVHVRSVLHTIISVFRV